MDAETSQRAVKTALDRWGHLDGLVLNAGILEPMGPVSSIPVDSPPDGMPLPILSGSPNQTSQANSPGDPISTPTSSLSFIQFRLLFPL